MKNKRLALLILSASANFFTEAVYAQAANVANGDAAAMSKLSVILSKTEEIASGTLDWSVLIFDVLLTSVMSAISDMPILNDPTTSTVIQAMAAIAFTWEFMIIVRDLQKGEFDFKQFGLIIINSGLIMCLYGAHDYRSMIPGTSNLWKKADSVSSEQGGVKTLDKDLFNIVKYFGSQVSAGFKPAGSDIFRIIVLSQSDSVIKKYCEKESYPNMLECRKDIFNKYENEGGALTSKGKEDVLKLVRERDYDDSLDIPQQIAYFAYSLTYTASFAEFIRMALSIVVIGVNIVGIVLANIVMLGSLLEASMMLIILKIIYPFMLVRTQRQKVYNILRGWLGFGLVGMVCTICSFVCDIMMMTGMNIITGSTSNLALNAILFGVLASPLAFGFTAVVKVLLISVLALKISLIKNVGKIAQGLMSLQIEGLSNLAHGAMQATMGMVVTGASIVAAGATGLGVAKNLYDGFRGGGKNAGPGGGGNPPASNFSNGAEPGEGGNFMPNIPKGGPGETNFRDEDETTNVNVKNAQEVGKNEVKTNASNTTSNPRNRIVIPEVDSDGKIKRTRDNLGRFTSENSSNNNESNSLNSSEAVEDAAGLLNQGLKMRGSGSRTSNFQTESKNTTTHTQTNKHTNQNNPQNTDNLNPALVKIMGELLEAIKGMNKAGGSGSRMSATPHIQREPRANYTPNSNNQLKSKINKDEVSPASSKSSSNSQNVKKAMAMGMDQEKAQQYADFLDELNKKKKDDDVKKKEDEKLSFGQRFIKDTLSRYEEEKKRNETAINIAHSAGNITSLKDPMEDVKRIHESKKSVLELDRKKLLSIFDTNRDGEFEITELVNYFRDREMNENPLSYVIKDHEKGNKLLAKKKKGEIKASRKSAVE